MVDRIRDEFVDDEAEGNRTVEIDCAPNRPAAELDPAFREQRIAKLAAELLQIFADVDPAEPALEAELRVQVADRLDARDSPAELLPGSLVLEPRGLELKNAAYHL
jgi:hypothetical protein